MQVCKWLPWMKRKCYAGNTGFLQSLDWSPFVISIKTGIVATILSFSLVFLPRVR